MKRASENKTDTVRRPRLLFLCHTLPYPPDGGPWIRTYHVLRLLARTFDVTALCFERGGVPATRLPILDPALGFSTDGFHASEAGYAAWAEHLLPLVLGES